VNTLREFEDIDLKDLKEDKVKLAAVERYFQRAIETVLDISSMIISQEGLGKPDEYRETIEKLGEEEILPEEFAERFADIAGFRNILVHQYSEIDVRKVHQNLTQNLDDFDVFAKHIAEWLED